MKLLLDTATFLNAALEPDRLYSRARELLLDPGNERYLSTISALEISIEHALGKIELSESPDQFVPAQRKQLGAATLLLDEESALHLARLPSLHRDPFDRVLICQAIVHGLVFLTPDEQIARYPVRTAW